MNDIKNKKISLLGSTGSIGRQSLDVCRQYPELEIVALAAFDEVEEIAAQAHEFKPQLVALADESKYHELKAALADIDCRIVMGEEGVCEAASFAECDTVLGAISGIAGLKPVYNAIMAGKDIALANKEVLVGAGELIMREAEAQNISLLPVDSEHSAIFQCLQGRKEEISRLIITASGGAFFGYNKDALKNVTAADALRHPTWKMGPKITVDSATLMNKGLEIIEAHHLFNMPYEKILPVIHRESIVHSMVEYCDGAVIALLSEPDMCLPIQYALTYPQRFASPVKFMDFSQMQTLTFRPCMISDFPCLELALEAAKRGDGATVALNAANEVLVHEFLKGRIGFMDIPRNLEKILSSFDSIRVDSLSYILEADAEARSLTRSLLA